MDINTLVERMVLERVADELQMLLDKVRQQIGGGAVDRAVRTSSPAAAVVGAARTAAASAPPDAPPVTVRVRKALASAGPAGLDFGVLYQRVLRGGPATKFAVKSALNKDRERKTIEFSGNKYRLQTQKPRAAIQRRTATRGSVVSAAAVT